MLRPNRALPADKQLPSIHYWMLQRVSTLLLISPILTICITNHISHENALQCSCAMQMSSPLYSLANKTVLKCPGQEGRAGKGWSSIHSDYFIPSRVTPDQWDAWIRQHNEYYCHGFVATLFIVFLGMVSASDLVSEKSIVFSYQCYNKMTSFYPNSNVCMECTLLVKDFLQLFWKSTHWVLVLWTNDKGCIGGMLTKVDNITGRSISKAVCLPCPQLITNYVG